MTDNKKQHEEDDGIGIVLDEVGDYLQSVGSYLKVYYEPQYGLQIEVYHTTEPGHMRDMELNRTHALVNNYTSLEEVLIALHKEIVK